MTSQSLLLTMCRKVQALYNMYIHDSTRLVSRVAASRAAAHIIYVARSVTIS